MIPNKLYLKYMLVKLLAKENKKEKAKLICNDILESKVKVNSAAVLQMKEEIKYLPASIKN